MTDELAFDSVTDPSSDAPVGPHGQGCDHVRDVEGPAAPPSRAVRAVIWYQRTFSGGPPTCRFFPSCSAYAREALEVHGTRRGLWLTVRRLARCRPFGPSGVDLVPEPTSPSSSASLRKAS